MCHDIVSRSPAEAPREVTLAVPSTQTLLGSDQEFCIISGLDSKNFRLDIGFQKILYSNIYFTKKDKYTDRQTLNWMDKNALLHWCSGLNFESIIW